MSNFYLGEIRMFGGNFAPAGWAICNGALLSISQNTALFSLLGTTYGGNGTTTFALPNMQGNAPVCPGTGAGLSTYNLGQIGGLTTHALTTSEMPAHTHVLNANTQNGDASTPGGYLYGKAPSRALQYYGPSNATAAMAGGVVGTGGGSQPHGNQQPFQVVTFIIATQGIYPSRS